MASNREKCVNSVARPVWRPEVSRGPSFWLLLTALLLIATSTGSWIYGLTSVSLHFYVCTPLYFLVAMCVHDAIHRAAHSKRILNLITGWVGSLTLGMTFPMIRRSHLKHHTSVGHEDDHEAFIYSNSLALPMRIWVSNWRCYGVWKELKTEERWQASSFLLAVLILLAWHPVATCAAWLVPMQLGVAAFTLTTVYLPHGALAPWVMRWCPGLTGFHDFHHMLPKYAWYQYFTFRVCEESNNR